MKLTMKNFMGITDILLVGMMMFALGYLVRDMQVGHYKRADVNHDGRVDLLDVSTVVRDMNTLDKVK